MAFAAGSNLEIRSDDIRFSKPTIIAGDHVRLYAKIYNVGTEDVSGYVSFFQGSVPIGNSQVVSTVSGGAPDEVYVDFIVPAGEFNVRAVIQGTDPVDQSLDNNVAITHMFTPVFDDDRDGIENGNDDCPTSANTDQQDSDADMVGDACDEDDDNDGLSDAVERELGTNPFSKDTDGDGVLDPNDAFPTDPKRSKREDLQPKPKPVAPPEPIPEPLAEPISASTPTPTPTPTSSPTPQKSSSIVSLLNKVVEQVKGNETEEPASNVVVSSTNAVFTYEHKAWNTFEFRVIGPAREGDVYEWDLGDGTTSSRTPVEHIYKASGTYTVRLTIHTPSGSPSTESVEIEVPFFSLHNPLILAIIGGLVVLLLAALAGIRVLAKRAQRRLTHPRHEDDEDDDVDDEEEERDEDEEEEDVSEEEDEDWFSDDAMHEEDLLPDDPEPPKHKKIFVKEE